VGGVVTCVVVGGVVSGAAVGGVGPVSFASFVGNSASKYEDAVARIFGVAAFLVGARNDEFLPEFGVGIIFTFDGITGETVILVTGGDGAVAGGMGVVAESVGEVAGGMRVVSDGAAVVSGGLIIVDGEISVVACGDSEVSVRMLLQGCVRSFAI